MEWNWVLNQSVAIAVLVFVGLVAWRVLVGTAKTGYQGLLIKWAQGLSDRMSAHADEQTKLGKIREKEHLAEISALQLLVEAQDPPVGAAFLSAKAVHKTAKEVSQLQASMIKFMKAFRLIASQFPDVEQAINEHCDEIERIMDDDIQKTK